MSAYYNQIRALVAEKTPRLVAEMHHYHSIQEMKLPAAQEKAAQAMFCFVEALKPSTPHPVDTTFYSCTIDIEVGHGNKTRLWLDEAGDLTDDPQLAAKVSQFWDRDAQGRAYHRGRAFAGIEKAKELIRTLGVPKGIRIHDNIPRS
jgi:hypothetical protein